MIFWGFFLFVCFFSNICKKNLYLRRKKKIDGMSICELKPVFKVLICINTKAFPSLCGNYLLACFCVTTKTDRKNCFQSDPFQSKGKIFLCFLFSVSLVAFSHCLYVLLPWWPPAAELFFWEVSAEQVRKLSVQTSMAQIKALPSSILATVTLKTWACQKKKKCLCGAKEQIYTQTGRPGAFLEVLKRLRFLK